MQEKNEKELQKIFIDLIKTALKQASADNGICVCFATQHKDVIIPDYLRRKYPDDMIISLHYQFNNLVIEDDLFEVELMFAGYPMKLVIPYASMRRIYDKAITWCLVLPDPELPDDEDEAEEEHLAEVIRVDFKNRKRL